MSPRTDKLFLYDIIECCEKVENYAAGVSEADFKNNKMLQDAVVRNIEVIGEASKNLSDELRGANSQVAWRDITRMRDKIAHHYFRIDLDVVWETIKSDIPELKQQAKFIYDGMDE
jgi:uncharacterized protein with HEPN domain